MSELKRVPELRFGEFSGEWEEKILENIIEVIDGDRGLNYPKSSDLSANGYCLFLSAKNVTKNGFSFVSQQFISSEKDNSMTKGKLKRNDVVLTTRGSVGHFSYYSNNILFENMRINSGMVLLRTKSPFLSSEYLYTSSHSSKIEKQIKIMAFGSAQPQLTVKEIKKIKISLPSKQEQEKIALFLSSVDSSIEQLTKKEKLLREYKKDAMQKIFNQELRFKDDDGSEFPGWVERSLEDCLILSLREVPKPQQNYLAIGIRSHCKGTFQKPDSNPSKIAMDKLYKIKEDDLIVSITFAWESAIAIVKKEDNNGLVSHRFPTYTFNKNITIVDFFRYVIIQKRFRFMLELISPGGAGRNRVMSKKDFMKLKWNIPCIKEQTKIANFLSSLDTKIDQANQQLNLTKEFKKALLQKMFV